MTDDDPDPDYPQSQPDRRGFWSGETLRLRLGQKKIIDPYRWQSVKYASYHLRLGGEAYVTPTGESSDRTKRLLKPGEGVEIPPGQLAFLLTEEVVAIPNDTIALVSMRTKAIGFRGLINVSGFHVDPGYQGRFIFAVFNAGPASVHVTRGEELFVIFFADLDRTKSTMVRKPDDSFKGIEGSMITPVSEEFLTFKGLDAKLGDTKDKLEARLKAVERDNAVIRWAAALILGFLIAFAVKSLTGDRHPLLADPVADVAPRAPAAGGVG